MSNLAHRRIYKYAMEVARVRSIQDYHQQVMVTHNTKEALDEIDVVDDVSLPCERCPCDHAFFLRIRNLCPLCNKNDSIASESVIELCIFKCFVELSLCLCLFCIFVMIAMILLGVPANSFSS
jgi:hypothetical protein